jgi:transposase
MDEARFGRMNRPRPCWAPKGVRPEVAVQLVREFTYLYGAVCPHDGSSFFLVLPSPDRTCFQIFLNALAKKFQRYHLLVVIDGAPSHRDASLRVPTHTTLLRLPPYAPELNPAENIWDEIREKFFGNIALKSMEAVDAKLNNAVLYCSKNKAIIKSIASFPYITASL